MPASLPQLRNQTGWSYAADQHATIVRAASALTAGPVALLLIPAARRAARGS
jgi:hypothetical protein